MNWYEHPDWRAFSDRVVIAPDDDTVRLVSADWLDETGVPMAALRAAMIRAQCAGEPGFGLRPGGYAARGFAEPAYRPTAGLWIARGFPTWAVFFPHRFTPRTVAPVFRAAPLTTCSTLGMCAQLVPETRIDRFGGRRPTEAFLFHMGPEDQDTGELENMAAIGAHTRRQAQSGRNPHADMYREPGYLPAPVYQSLPREGGAGGAVDRDERRDRYRRSGDAAVAALKAAWNVGRQFAGLKLRVGRTVPKPLPAAVEAFMWRTQYVNNARTHIDEVNPTRPSGIDPTTADPWAFMEARKLVAALGIAPDGGDVPAPARSK